MRKVLALSLAITFVLTSTFTKARTDDEGRNVIWYIDSDHIASTCDITRYAVAGWRIIPTTNADFNGDGKSDILWWQGDSAYTNFGSVVVWNMDGCEITPYAHYLGVIADVDWKMTTFGDFNGDGKTDILWSYIEQ